MSNQPIWYFQSFLSFQITIIIIELRFWKDMWCELNKHSQIQTSLIKIQIDLMFGFKNELAWSITKTHVDDKKWETTKNKRKY
jgi:hypothetical protein